MTIVDEIARRVTHHVDERGASVEAAIDYEISRVDEPVDSEAVLQAYAERHGSGA